MIGTAMLAAGLLALSYGALAFWLIQSLPPNGGHSKRLPSVYVMISGMLAALVGLVVRDCPLPGRGRRDGDPPLRSIPTSVGLLLLFAIVALVIVAIVRS